MTSIMADPLLRERIRVSLKTLYYLAIVIGLLVYYSRGNITMPNFVYQGF